MIEIEKAYNPQGDVVGYIIALDNGSRGYVCASAELDWAIRRMAPQLFEEKKESNVIDLFTKQRREL